MIAKKRDFSPHPTLSVPTAANSDSRLLVSVHREGVAVVSQGGRSNRVEPGDIFVIDPARPFSIECGDICSRSFYLSTSAVRALIPQLDHLTAVPIRNEIGVAAMFRATADELFAFAGTICDDIADRVGEALPYLLAPALASLESATGEIPTRLRQLHKRPSSSSSATTWASRAWTPA